MELRVHFLKAEIEAIAESLEARLVDALAEKKELEAEVLVKNREYDLVKEKEEISIATTADPAAAISNFSNCANYAHMGEVLRHRHLHHHIGIT